MPLQMVLAEQTARARALRREREFSGLIRAAWLGTFLVWLVAVVVVLLFQRTIMAQWNGPMPAAIWLTLPVLLFTAWVPMCYGLLQGQQNFLWMGWSMLVQRGGPGGHKRFRGHRAALLCPGDGAGHSGRPDRRPHSRGLADAVPVASVPTVFRMAQRAASGHSADAGIWGVPVYADGRHDACQGVAQWSGLRVLRQRRDVCPHLDVAGRPTRGGEVPEDRACQGEGGKERPDGRRAARDRDPGRGRGRRFVGGGSLDGGVDLRDQTL